MIEAIMLQFWNSNCWMTTKERTNNSQEEIHSRRIKNLELQKWKMIEIFEDIWNN